MTSVPYARLVLDDVRIVLSRLEDEKDEREWRLAWVLALVLLRTVGDVLHRVDGADDLRVLAASDELYKSWKAGDENAIFRDFIKLERDSLVHEYATSMTEGSVSVGVVRSGSEDTDEDGVHWLGENLYRPMGGGKFAGEDGRDLIEAAISWWRRQLDEIDRRMTS